MCCWILHHFFAITRTTDYTTMSFKNCCFLGSPGFKHPSLTFTGICVCRDEHNAGPISLDVGGTVYTASRAVLKVVPDSWLARVVNGSIKLPKNANDVRFIERDSQVCSQAPCKTLASISALLVHSNRPCARIVVSIRGSGPSVAPGEP
jgi:hypothetical protein